MKIPYYCFPICVICIKEYVNKMFYQGYHKIPFSDLYMYGIANSINFLTFPYADVFRVSFTFDNNSIKIAKNTPSTTSR